MYLSLLFSEFLAFPRPSYTSLMSTPNIPSLISATRVHRFLGLVFAKGAHQRKQLRLLRGPPSTDLKLFVFLDQSIRMKSWYLCGQKLIFLNSFYSVRYGSNQQITVWNWRVATLSPNPQTLIYRIIVQLVSVLPLSWMSSSCASSWMPAHKT